MHACFHGALLCLCAARHECAHARPPCIITPTCYRQDIFHACMYAGRHVCMLPQRSACLCAIFPRTILGFSLITTVLRLAILSIVPCLPVTRARRQQLVIFKRSGDEEHGGGSGTAKRRVESSLTLTRFPLRSITGGGGHETCDVCGFLEGRIRFKIVCTGSVRRNGGSVSGNGGAYPESPTLNVAFAFV